MVPIKIGSDGRKLRSPPFVERVHRHYRPSEFHDVDATGAHLSGSASGSSCVWTQVLFMAMVDMATVDMTEIGWHCLLYDSGTEQVVIGETAILDSRLSIERIVGRPLEMCYQQGTTRRYFSLSPMQHSTMLRVTEQNLFLISSRPIYFEGKVIGFLVT